MRTRVLPLLILAILLIMACVTIVMHQQTQRRIDDVRFHHIHEVNEQVQLAFMREIIEMSKALHAISMDETLRQAMVRLDRESLVAHGLPIYDDLKARTSIRHFYFHRPNGTNLLRLHNLSMADDQITRTTLAQAQQTGQLVSGLEISTHGSAVLRVVIPWRVDDQLVGYLELGTYVEDMVVPLSQLLGDHVVYIINKNQTTRSAWEKGRPDALFDWDLFEDVVIIASTMDHLPDAVREHLAGKLASVNSTMVTVADRSHHMISLPLKNINGQPLGYLVAMHDSTAEIRSAKTALFRLYGVGLVVMVGLIAFFYRFLGAVEREITNRNRELAQANEQLTREVAERKQAEAQVRQAHDLLETHVQQRTAELNQTINNLKTEINLREQVEQMLRESEKQFRIMFDSAPIGMAMTEMDGTLTRVNPEYLRIVGYSEDELRELSYWDMTPEEYKPQELEVLESLRTTARYGPYEKQYVRKDGRRIPVRLNGVKITSSDGRPRIWSIVEDISQRIRTEELERERESLADAVEAMNKVLGVIGHELRTPLAGLRAISELLIDPTFRETAEAEQFIHSINKEVIRMSAMVNNLLEAARLSSGVARWNWSELALAEVCNEALQTVQPLIDKNKVQLVCDVAPSDLKMSGDPGAICRLVLNLTDNARKYTEQGHIKVHVRPFVDNGQRWVQLVVSDTGRGIPQDVVDRLGQAFALNSGTLGHSHVSGSGLGLAICKGIVAAHGGSITVCTGIDKGTAIFVRMRADLPEPAELTDINIRHEQCDKSSPVHSPREKPETSMQAV